MRRTSLLAAILSLSLFVTGCLGPNRAFNGVHEWNQQASDNEYVNEAIFLGCHFLPVYGLAYFIDIVVLNTVEYWTGDNPMDS